MIFLFRGRHLPVIAVVMLAITGCKDALQKDVTNDPKYGDFFGVVGQWKSEDSLELYEVDKSLHLVPEDVRHYIGGRIILTVPIGTEIRIDRLIYHEDPIGGSSLSVMGGLVSGPYAGKPIELDDRFFRPNPFTHPEVSKPPPDWTFKWTVSPDILSN